MLGMKRRQFLKRFPVPVESSCSQNVCYVTMLSKFMTLKDVQKVLMFTRPQSLHSYLSASSLEGSFHPFIWLSASVAGCLSENHVMDVCVVGPTLLSSATSGQKQFIFNLETPFTSEIWHILLQLDPSTHINFLIRVLILRWPLALVLYLLVDLW